MLRQLCRSIRNSAGFGFGFGLSSRQQISDRQQWWQVDHMYIKGIGKSTGGVRQGLVRVWLVAR